MSILQEETHQGTEARPADLTREEVLRQGAVEVQEMAMLQEDP